MMLVPVLLLLLCSGFRLQGTAPALLMGASAGQELPFPAFPTTSGHSRQVILREGESCNLYKLSALDGALYLEKLHSVPPSGPAETERVLNVTYYEFVSFSEAEEIHSGTAHNSVLGFEALLCFVLALAVGFAIGSQKRAMEQSISAGSSPSHCGVTETESIELFELIEKIEPLSPIEPMDELFVPSKGSLRPLNRENTQIIENLVKPIEHELVLRDSNCVKKGNLPFNRFLTVKPSEHSSRSEFSKVSSILNNGNYHRQFTVEKTLGRGGFGSVELARHKLEGRPYAIKKLYMELAPNEEIHSHEVFKEVKTLMQLQSKYIVRYNTCWAEQAVERPNSLESSCSELENSFDRKFPVFLYIQMEYCKAVSLSKFLKTRQSIDYAKNVQFLTHILKGVKYIHSKGIIHRDLKPDNIFLDKHENAKLGDFNLATKLPSFSVRNQLSKGIGTPYYRAPEQEKSAKYGPKVDVYSLGMLTLELFSNFTTKHEKLAVLRDLKSRNELPRTLVADYPLIGELVQWLVSTNSEDRPTAHEVLASDLFLKLTMGS